MTWSWILSSIRFEIQMFNDQFYARFFTLHSENLYNLQNWIPENLLLSVWKVWKSLRIFQSLKTFASFTSLAIQEPAFQISNDCNSSIHFLGWRNFFPNDLFIQPWQSIANQSVRKLLKTLEISSGFAQFESKSFESKTFEVQVIHSSISSRSRSVERSVTNVWKLLKWYSSLKVATGVWQLRTSRLQSTVAHSALPRLNSEIPKILLKFGRIHLENSEREFTSRIYFEKELRTKTHIERFERISHCNGVQFRFLSNCKFPKVFAHSKVWCPFAHCKLWNRPSIFSRLSPAISLDELDERVMTTSEFASSAKSPIARLMKQLSRRS